MGWTRHARLFLLLLVVLAAAPARADEQDDEVEKWIDVMATGKETHAFEALNALIQLGEKAKQPALELLGDESEPEIRRWQAAKVLGAIGAKDAAPDLIKAMDDVSKRTLVTVVADELGRLKAESALPRLRALLDEFKDPQQRYWIELAIARIEGRPEPRQPGAPDPSEPWTQPPIETGTPYSDSIGWAPDVETALARAKEQERLVLATVVPVQDNRWCSGYADAKGELVGVTPHPWGDARAQAIDAGLVKERALMASVFTDPRVVALVNAHTVPVRIRLHTFQFDPKSPARSQDPLPLLGTTALAVGGPALVVASSDGTLLHACRRLGVLSAPHARGWLEAVITQAGREVGDAPADGPKGLVDAWGAAREGRFADAAAVLSGFERARLSAFVAAEVAYLRGHVEDKLGLADEAQASWQSAVELDPTGPWGSKAAVRLQPRGIRLDEWESFHAFPGDPLGERTEVGSDKIDEVFAAAARYLLLQQRAGGGWVDPFVDVSVAAGPGSAYDRAVARTGIIVDALLALRDHLPDQREDIERAARRGIAFVGRFADDPKPYIWQQTYALHLQVALLKAKFGDQAKAKARAASLIKSLAGNQQDGGWSYMHAPRIHSFNTAPVLLYLVELKEVGVPVPGDMLAEAAAFLESVRQADDERNFHYAPTMPFPVRASSCRSALCELALMMHSGEKDRKRLEAAVDLFFEMEPSVRSTTKVFEAYFAIGPLHDAYHYYFGHYYTARALSLLSKSKAEEYAEKQIETVLGQFEIDGSFVDAQMQGKSYSTAMAVLSLIEDLRYAKP